MSKIGHRKGKTALVGSTHKVCNECRKIKLLSEYHLNKRLVGGVVGTCKKCRSSYNKRWRQNTSTDYREVANSKNRDKKQKLVNLFGNKCLDCQATFPLCVYDFHHLDPTIKDREISYLIRSPEKLMKEIDKCVMLCANCHRIRHHEGIA